MSGSRARRGAPARVAAAAAGLVLLLGACPGGDAPPGPTPRATAPDRGGEVIVAYPHEPSMLNPFVTGGDAPATRDLVRPLMPGLYRLGPKGTREPWLLASEPTEADIGGTPFSVRLHLREEAVWSDGRPITASDLQFTWRAVRATRTIATRDGYDRLTDVVVESPKVARLVFAEPFARWRDLFSAGLGVLPAHALGIPDLLLALRREWPVSGGPFVLRSWTPGLEMVFERNPRAWEAPLLDRIRVQFVPDPVTALQLFARGLVDVLGPYPAVEFARRAGAAQAGATVTGDRGATWAGLFLNVRTPALADARVRRALATALDRVAIVEGLVREQGARIDGPSAGDPARSSPSFSRYGFDREEAVRGVDAAGWTARSAGATRRKGSQQLSVTLAAVGSDELTQRVLRALNAQARAVGIDLNLVSLDSDHLWGTWLSSARFQSALLVVRDPPGGDLRARFGIPGTHNVSELADKTLRDMLLAADRTLDDASPVVDAPASRVAELVPVIPLYVLEVTLAARAGVHEVQASAATDGFLWNAEQWWRDGGGGSPTPTPSGSPSGS